MNRNESGALAAGVAGRDAATLVRGGADVEAEQGSVYASGISAETVGSTALWLGMITLPAGRRTTTHLHAGHESALYMLSGQELEILSGSDLQHREVIQPGDYLFIPAGVPHVAENRADTAAVFMGARTDPNANESVVLLPDLDARYLDMRDPTFRTSQ
jgi:uncharacterized RmlC-like cupin family protein